MKASYTKKLVSHMGALIFILLSTFFLTHDSFAAAAWLSSVAGTDVPTTIALDAKGNIYVTEARDKSRLRIFDRNGALLRTLGVKKPSGVAVDGQGRIYVANNATNSVDVYNSDLTLSHSLGAGKNEFRSPKAVAVAANGSIYVSDSKDNLIKVYNPNGTKASSFGGWGKTDGKFNVPLGLAINEAAGELYVSDLGIFVDGTNGDTYGARIQVFDLQGTFKRSFGTYGAGEGKMIRPVSIALDGDGRVYVADSFQGVVHVFDGNGAPVETIFDRDHATKTPISVAVGKDNRVFIASNNQKAVEVFGMTGYTTMDVSPKSLSFTAVQGSGALPAQTASVGNSGTGTLGWSAAADRGWITVTPATGASAPASPLSVGVSAAGLVAGSYSGSVTVTAASGAAETVAVQLTVTPPPAALSVTPGDLAFTAQQNGSAPPVKTIDIRNSSVGAMTWTAAKSQSWLSLSAASGAAPSQITASVSPGLPVGTHTDTVIITAPGAQGSPALVSVTVTVGNTGTVTITTNLSQAGFTVTGPAPATTALTGSGTLWKNEEMEPGDYTVSFNHVTGYKKPATRTVTVASGNETAVQADYVKKAAATHIVAVTGATTVKNLSVMTLGGEPVSSFRPFAYAVADVHVASGDLDAGGTDKIVAADNLRSVKVFSTDGNLLAAFTLPKGYKNAGLAVGDMDGDGRAEIVLGTVIDRIGKPDIRGVRLLGYANGKIEEKASVYSEEKNGGYTLAVGDLNGDGEQDVVMADASRVRALSLAGGVLGEVWSVQGSFKAVPKVSAGDLNDDGNAEVVLSLAGSVQVLTGTGEPTGVIIGPPAAGTKPAAVACGDVDNDGVEEIATRTGGSLQSAGTVRFLEGDGSALGTAVAVNGGVGGANFCLGSF